MKNYLEKYLFAALLPAGAALMVACSDTYYADDYRNYDKEFGREQDEEVGVDSIEWDTVRLELGGKFNLASVLEPVQLNISALNKKMERQQTVSARIVRNRLDFTYKAKEMELATPFVEYDFVCRHRDSKDTAEMHFTAYASFSEDNAANIDLYHALESKYLKKLVQKKGESFNLARKHAHIAIHALLDPEQETEYGIKNAPYGNDTLETLAYHYTLFFLKDSLFYKNFEKLADAVGGDKRWDDVLSSKEITDGLIEHYRLGESQSDSSVFETLKKDPDFTQFRYDVAIWIVGDTSNGKTSDGDVRDTSKTTDTTKTEIRPEVTAAEKFGECTINRQNQKVMLDTGKYYQCKDKEWIPIVAPVYYELKGDEGDYVTYDGEYFHCSGNYSWDKVKPEDVLPPIKDLRKCNKSEIVKYGDKFYECNWIRAYWYELPADSISRYQKNGTFCVDSTEGRIEQDNGSYWTCMDFNWVIMGFIDSVVYSFNLDHKDECRNGPKGTTVHWNDTISKRYSSQTYLVCDGSSLEWEEVGIAERDHYEGAIFDGAVFVDDSTFKATNGNFTYTVLKRKGWAGIFDIVGIEADIGDKEYGAMFRDKKPYLSGKRGGNDLAVDVFPGKSENFESFVAQYTHPESAYPAYNVELTRVGVDSYMNWEQAAAFCPAGFHVPDTSEWTENFLKSFPVEARYAQDSPLRVRYNGTEYLYDIYWTRASKDSETHYCYEIRYEGDKGPMNRVIECPDNLYPGVQTMCFKDGEE